METTPRHATAADSQPGNDTPAWLRDTVRAIEADRRLDAVGDLLRPVTDALLRDPRVASVLRGDLAGHALHPRLTDLPLGAWFSATLLDVFGRRRSRPAAAGLVGFGLVAAAPTVASGLVEWSSTSGPDRRVGVVHAAVNAAAASCYLVSFGQRIRGRHARGVLAGLAGGGLAVVGGYLGGHLAVVRKVGSVSPGFGADAGEGTPVDLPPVVAPSEGAPVEEPPVTGSSDGGPATGPAAGTAGVSG